jgi:hypothetical protein
LPIAALHEAVVDHLTTQRREIGVVECDDRVDILLAASSRRFCLRAGIRRMRSPTK